MMSAIRSDWTTPAQFYAMLDREFHFDLDACASPENALCDNYFTRQDESLREACIWRRRVWVNPPYGLRLGAWVEKAYRSAAIGARQYTEHVVMLLPARTDTSWFHDYCLKAEIRFLRGRLCFDDNPRKRAPFPSMIVIFRGGGPS
jgi:phage N-6-adenine-methyltransferase